MIPKDQGSPMQPKGREQDGAHGRRAVLKKIEKNSLFSASLPQNYVLKEKEKLLFKNIEFNVQLNLLSPHFSHQQLPFCVVVSMNAL